MTTSKKLLLAISVLAICAVIAPGLGTASARNAKPAAVTVVNKDIYIQGTTNDGWFWWADQLDPWVTGYQNISIKSGSTRFFFIWGHDSDNPGFHNVSLNKTSRNLAWRTGICSTSACTKTTASTALKFTNSRTQQNLGTADIRYPTTGWVPTAPAKKKALYSLYCNLHPNMVMRIYVQG